MFVRPGNDDNAEDDGGDIHLGRTSRNDCSATLSGTPAVNIFNNKNMTPLSPLSVGVDDMQLPERPSLSPVSASTTNKKSKDANHQRSSQEISFFIPVEEDDLTGTLCDQNTSNPVAVAVKSQMPCPLHFQIIIFLDLVVWQQGRRTRLQSPAGSQVSRAQQQTVELSDQEKRPLVWASAPGPWTPTRPAFVAT
jgi:hypothetical protein